MKNITIKKDKTLIKLAEFLNREPDELIEEILINASKDDYIVDDICELQHKFIDHFTSLGDLHTNSGACILCTGSTDMVAVDLFSELKLWGTGDCPLCGCESEESEDHPNQWTFGDDINPPELIGEDNRVCMNDKCNHEFQI